MKAKEEKFSLQKAFQELEAVVAELENGQVDLDQSLVKFRRGLALSQAIKRHLEKIKKEIRIIREKNEEG